MRAVYLDHQASTPLAPGVLDAMLPFFEHHYANPSSSDHGMGWKASAAIDDARASIASAISCGTEEIILTSGATESNNMAILGVCRQSIAARRRIVVCAIEHKSVLEPCRAVGLRGYGVVVVPVDRRGVVDLDRLEEAVDDRTALVSVMAVNNEIGTAQPIAAVSSIARRRGALMHCDASQALSWMPLDVDALDVDLMSMSSHKAGGPKGVGALFVRRGTERALDPISHGGSQERGLRPGTLPTPLCVGFGRACEALPTPDEVSCWRAATARLLSGLRGLAPDLAVNGRGDHPGSLNVRFPGRDAADLILRAQPRLAVAQGSACTSGMPEPSHVLLALGLTAGEAAESIRFSPGVRTTDAEVSAALEVMGEVLAHG